MKSGNGIPQRRNGKLFILLGVGVALVCILLTIVLFRTEILHPPAFLRELLRLPVSDSQNGEATPGFLPEITPDSEMLRNRFFDYEPSELLSVLKERNSYVRTIRVIHSYGSDHVLKRYTITKQGNFWRADTDTGKIIWNGRELYRENAVSTYRSDSGDFNFFEEIGITPLNQIRHTAEEKGYRYALDDNRKILSITISDTENGIRNEYEISVESGVVLSETSYYQDTAFRTVLTDSIDYFGALSLPDDFFTIP